MPRKVTKETAKGNLFVPLGPELEIKLRDAADDLHVRSAAALLRSAAEAIVRARAEGKSVAIPIQLAPLDIDQIAEIIKRRLRGTPFEALNADTLAFDIVYHLSRSARRTAYPEAGAESEPIAAESAGVIPGAAPLRKEALDAAASEQLAKDTQPEPPTPPEPRPAPAVKDAGKKPKPSS